MQIRLYAAGIDFEGNSDLQSTVELLSGYESAFNWCLRKSSVVHETIITVQQPRLKLTSLKRGSVDFGFVAESAAATLAVAPQILSYAWQLYGTASDLISIATRFFDNTGKAMTINIQNSPGAVVNVVGNDQINTSDDTYQAAKAIHPSLEKIAKIVKDGKAEKIISQPDISNYKPVQIDSKNKNFFKVKSVTIKDDMPSEIRCDIYRFNTKTLTGTLEYYVDNESSTCTFVADEDLKNDCINALATPLIFASAYKEYKTNALGETKIKKLYIEKLYRGPDKRSIR